MAHLKWLVVRDLNMIESATFWKDGPEIETGELRTEDIGTEVFFFPAASHVEKDGTFTQTQRMLQWHHKAVEPPGDCRSELHFFFHLGRKMRERLAGSTDERDRPLLDLTWDYPVDEHGEPSAEAVLREINGCHLTGDKAGQPLSSYTEMKPTTARPTAAAGSTPASTPTASTSPRGASPAASSRWVAPEWGWAWPANRRILYNRASADPDGKPWSERKAYVWWDAEASRSGPGTTSRTSSRPRRRPTAPSRAPAASTGSPATTRSSCRPTARAGCSRPTGLLDGPLPAHYEPSESPVRNPLYRQQANPARKVFPRKDNLQNPSPPEPQSDVFPYVFTTYRLTEHHTAGGMSRWLPYLSELQPEFFCEVSPELAAERGLEHLGWATIVTARTAIEARVLVTERMAPLTVGGRTIHQVGLPYHWGVGGDALVERRLGQRPVRRDARPERAHPGVARSASCDIRPGRRPTGAGAAALRRRVPQPAPASPSRPGNDPAHDTSGG